MQKTPGSAFNSFCPFCAAYFVVSSAIFFHHFIKIQDDCRWLRSKEITERIKNHQINKLSRQHTNRKIRQNKKNKSYFHIPFFKFQSQKKRKSNCTQKLVQEKWYCPKNVCKKKTSIFIYRDGMVNRIEENRTKIQIHSLTLFLSPLSLSFSMCMYLCVFV